MYARYLQGRNSNGAHRDAGRLNHGIYDAYSPSFSKAVCGAHPGKTSGGWSTDVLKVEHINCPRCLKIMKTMAFRIQWATDLATEDFWAKIAKCFPEITTGDFPPDAHFAFEQAVKDAVKIWVEGNLPEGAAA